MSKEPNFTVIETSRGKDPAIVVVDSSVRQRTDSERYSWHLTVVIACRSLGANGMPTSLEGEVLNLVEDNMSPKLMHQNNAVFLARETCRGERTITYRVRDPEVANRTLQNMIADEMQPREWVYEMEEDVGWALAQPMLNLVGRGPHIH